MRAIILAGGVGTRMHPLSRRTPKALLPVLNRPLLEHMLLHLGAHGVRHATLALTRPNETIPNALGDGRRLGVSLDYAYEEAPLGSGGAIASITRAWRSDGWDGRFVVCNGDIVTDLDLSAMLAAHRMRGAELSIALYEVVDPSPYGVVALDGGDRITQFIEKPTAALAPSRLVNAGTWIFEPQLIDEMDPSGFNRAEEVLFPAMAAARRAIHGFHPAATYWADVGHAAALLRVNLDLASARAAAAGDGIVIGEPSRIDTSARVEGPCVIGGGSTIARGAHVAESLLWEGVQVGPGATVRRSILAEGVRVGAGAVLDDVVIAHGTPVPAGGRITGALMDEAALAGAAEERAHG